MTECTNGRLKASTTTLKGMSANAALIRGTMKQCFPTGPKSNLGVTLRFARTGRKRKSRHLKMLAPGNGLRRVVITLGIAVNRLCDVIVPRCCSLPVNGRVPLRDDCIFLGWFY